MGNTRYYTKDNGQSFAELEYDVWGAVTSPEKLNNNDNGNFAAAVFTGHPYDTVLDIYFAEARFYDAKHRQWMASDPIKSGLNWYEYCYSNPATLLDPNGLTSVRIDQVIDHAVTQAKNLINEVQTEMSIEKERKDKEAVERANAIWQQRQDHYKELDYARNEAIAQDNAEKALKKYLKEVEDQEIREQAFNEWAQNKAARDQYWEQVNEIRISAEKEKDIKKYLKEVEDQEIRERAFNEWARNKAARDQYWEDARNDPTWPRTIVDDARDLANWAEGHYENHKRDINYYFQQITCEVEKAQVQSLLDMPKEMLKFTIFSANETVQLGGKILGDYDLTFMLNGDAGLNFGSLTGSASLGYAFDTKGNIWKLKTVSGGASASLGSSLPAYADLSLLVMPGGNIKDWDGNAINTGGSVTLKHIAVGADFALLEQPHNEAELKVVGGIKLTTDVAGIEFHRTRSYASPNEDWSRPFNVLEWLDRAAKNAYKSLDSSKENKQRGQRAGVR